MTENELLTELILLLKLEPVKPDEITANMLANSLSISRSNAMIKLKNLEKEGKLTSRMASSKDNHAVLAFKRAD